MRACHNNGVNCPFKVPSDRLNDALLSSAAVLSFHLSILFFEPWHLQTASLQSHTSHSRLWMRTSLFLIARAVEREMQEVELWRGRNGTRCLLLSCPPPSVPASPSLLIQPVRRSTRAIPLDVEASLPAALARLFFPSLSSFWLPLFSCALPCFNPGIQISLNSWGESAGALVTAVDLIKTPRNRSGNIKVRKYNKSPRVNWTGGHLILFMNRIHASQICGAWSLNPQVMM